MNNILWAVLIAVALYVVNPYRWFIDAVLGIWPTNRVAELVGGK